tara:strand:+ start:1305 stop:2078 length:774 start_codon:yes stop_codon:yes gene_type:complete
MKKEDISIQLYTARKFQPYEEILKFFSNSGLSNIELFGVEKFDEIKMKDLLQKYNLSSLSSHVSFSGIQEYETILKLKKLNIKHAIVPSPSIPSGKSWEDNFKKNEQEWNQFGKALGAYVKIYEDHGLTLGYHNHAFEFKKLPSGKMPIECILDNNENLKFEIDLGWVVASKQDPIIWIKKYANKIIACHLKDFYSKNKNLQDHKEQSPIGDGFIDWSTIIPEVKKTNCELYVIEHDDPISYKEYTKKSIINLERIN